MFRTGAARILCIALPTAALACSDPAPPSAALPRLEPTTRQIYLMGTMATLTVYAENAESGRQRIEGMVGALEEAESTLSSWRLDSLVGRINRHPVGADFLLEPRLCRLFAEVFEWSRRSGGAFDPAVEPLIAVWGIRDGGRVPSPVELTEALSRSGLRRFRFDPDRCLTARLTETGLDTGAFGKGAALDWLRQTPAAEAGPWLVDLGGQVAVGPPPPGERGWEVGLADPRQRERAALELRLDSGSLATSGGSERDLEAEGERVGHILDPRDGRPAAYRGSVTVWHQSALSADILSTALYVMGPDEGLAWAESLNVAALFMSESAQPRATRRFRERFPAPR